MTDIEKIARGLTDGQREWILHIASDEDHSDAEIEEACEEWEICHDLGLCDYWTDQLTPLGLQVRDFLRSEGNG